MKDKSKSRTDDQDVAIAEQNSPITFAYQHPIPVGAVFREILGVDQWRDFGIFRVVDDRIDNEMMI
jgi:hypothetical protein